MRAFIPLITLTLIIATSFSGNAQVPWYRFLGTNSMSANLDEITKVYEIHQLDWDSSYMILAENTSELWVYKLGKAGNPNGGWKVHTYGTLNDGNPCDLVIAPNGDFYVYTYQMGLSSSWSMIRKYNAFGAVVWDTVDTYPNQFGLWYRSICLSPGNDTLYAFDNANRYSIDPNTGIYFGSIPFNAPGANMISFPNGDFMCSDFYFDTGLFRKSANGTLIYSKTGGASDYNQAFGAVFNESTGMLSKYDIVTGATLWSTPVSVSGVSDLSISPGGGVVGVTFDSTHLQPHYMFYVDSAGVFQWMRTYQAGVFGFTQVRATLDGGFLVGGGYLETSCDGFTPVLPDYSGAGPNKWGPFVVWADSSGNGPDSLSNKWSGDFNNDGIYDITDGLYLGVAMNATGVPMDNKGIQDPGYYCSMQPAVDWPQAFTNGVNYKHVDCDGDGVIDVTDTDCLTFYIGVTHPGWKYGNSSAASSGSVIRYAASADTVTGGQSFQVYVIAGSDSAKIDSIYVAGFSQYSMNYFLIDESLSSFEPYNGTFGTPGTNTITYNNNTICSVLQCADYYVSRTNQVNAFQFHDTIAVFDLTSKPVFTPSVFDMNMFTARYMSYYQDLQFQTIIDGTVNVVIMPVSTGIEDYEVADLNLYPNPASDVLSIVSELPVTEVRLFDAVGQLALNRQLSGTDLKLDVSHLPEGIYTIQLAYDSGKRVNRLLPVVR